MLLPHQALLRSSSESEIINKHHTISSRFLLKLDFDFKITSYILPVYPDLHNKLVSFITVSVVFFNDSFSYLLILFNNVEKKKRSKLSSFKRSVPLTDVSTPFFYIFFIPFVAYIFQNFLNF